VRIPDCKKRADPGLLESPSTLKPLPEMAEVALIPSYHLQVLYRCSYCVFAIAVLIALYPYFLIFPAVLLLVLCCCWGLWRAYKHAVMLTVTTRLSFSSRGWIYTDVGSAQCLEITGTVVCWSWLIILPFRSVSTGKARLVLIFNDSLSIEDSARLRRWLLANLVPRT
jgi:hypothetical protein